MKTLYICVMNSGRLTGEIVRVFAPKSDYSHVGFSFNSSLNPLYSFGRKNYRFPFPGGFVSDGFGTSFYNRCPNGRLLLFTKEITDKQFADINTELKPFIDSPSCYKYDFLNIISHMLHKPCHRKNHYICTSFCGELLGSTLGLCKDTTMLTPQDYAELGLNIKYKGRFKSYRPV